MATVELFRICDFPGPVDIDGIRNMVARRRDEEVAILEEDKDVRARLNLDGQVALIDRRIAKAEQEMREGSPLDASCYYPEISTEEISRWNLWVPYGSDLAEYGQRWDYNYIPERVLTEIATLQGINLFERMRIMSHNEERSHEAFLVGYVGGRMFRVARWGEHLKPANKVLGYIKRAGWYENMKDFFGVGGNFGIGPLIFFGVVVLFMWLGSGIYYDDRETRRHYWRTYDSCEACISGAHTGYDRFVNNVHGTFNPIFAFVRNNSLLMLVLWITSMVYFGRFDRTRYLDRFRR